VNETTYWKNDERLLNDKFLDLLVGVIQLLNDKFLDLLVGVITKR